jgi:hypothetical protein
VHNFSFANWAFLEELQSPFCLLVGLLLFQTKNCLGLAYLVFWESSRMVGVEDRNEDVIEEEASGPSSFPDATAPVPTPFAEDGGVIFVLEKASLEVAKVGKVKKTKEIPSPFLSGEEGGEFFFRRSHDRDVHNEGDYKGDAIRGRGLRTPFRGSKRRGALGACVASFGLPNLLHYFSFQSLSLSLTFFGF